MKRILLLLLCAGCALAQYTPPPATSAIPSGPCGGDLGGTYPNCTVTGLTHAPVASGSQLGVLSAANWTTFNAKAPTASPTFTGNPVSPSFQPASDSTTAFRVFKADGTTAVLVVDTTNGRLGIGGTPSFALDVNGSTRMQNTFTCCGGSGMVSTSGSAFMQMVAGTGANGTTWYRNSNDAFPVIAFNQNNGSATGDIFQAQNQGVVKVSVSSAGVLNMTQSSFLWNGKTCTLVATTPSCS